jgi:curved DNA-binding protein
MTDYYSILGVDRSASSDEIKKAYRRMASQHHPDKGGDTGKFQQIEEAYRTLSDDNARSQYDNPQPRGGEFHFHAGGGNPFEDVFRHFGGGFGDIFGQRQQARNRTINLQTVITLEDAFYGKELVANIILPSNKDQMITVKIPSGIQDGTTLRLSGLGDDSHPHMPRGDIHLTIQIQPHNIFQRQGDDLIQNFNVTVWEALLGENLRVRTIDDRIFDIKIPDGSQQDQILNIPDCGMPNINSGQRGRLLLKLKIIIPNNLTEKQKSLIKQINS